jgi:beta-lactamase regulating signal transducer with metallopeptidase domain
MQTILECGLSNAVFATVLAVVAFAITRFWRAPAVAHVLWLVVLAKFITPPLIAVPIPSADWIAARGLPSAAPAPVTEASAQLPKVDVERETTIGLDTWIATLLLPAVEATTESPAPVAETTLETAKAEPWLHWDSAWNAPTIAATWVAGSILFLVIATLRVRTFQRVLRYAQPAPHSIQLETVAIAGRLGLRHCPSVWLAAGRFSPLLWAVGGKARLIIPADLLEQLRRDQQSALLAHELAHARRHDHWVRWLELAVTCLYWWHPVVWWGRHELQQAEEQCCDAWVVWALPRAAKAYAKALLQTVEFLDGRPALPPVASGIGHVHHLKRRLNMIVRSPLSPRLSWPAYLGIALVAFVVLPLGTSRLFSQTQQRDVTITVDDDDDTQPDADRQKQRQDMEQRLDRLERRMNRIIRALEERSAKESKEAKVRKDDKESKDAKAGKEEKRVRVIARVKDDQDSKEGAKAETRRGKGKGEATGGDEKRRIEVRVDGIDTEKAKQLQRMIDDAVKRATDPERIKALQKRIEESVHRAVDPEKMKELEKRIEVMLNKNLDPEKLKALHKEMEESVHRNFNPEQMKDLQRQLEESVKKSIDPERMKKLGKEIEESVKRSIEESKHAVEHAMHEAEHAKQQAEHVRKEADEARQQAEHARQEARERQRSNQAREERERARAERSARTQLARPDRPDRDLERRVQRLEERMDRILEKLESPKDHDNKD